MQFHRENITSGGRAYNLIKAVQSVNTNTQVKADRPSPLIEVELLAS